MEIKYRSEFGKLLEQYGLQGYAAEIGVAEGRNAEVLIASPAITKLYLIDFWGTLNQSGDGANAASWHEQNYLEARQRVKHYQEKAIILKGLSSKMIEVIEDGSLIFAYIDGDHSYKGCMSDLVAIYPKVKVGGIISLHDIKNTSYGVAPAVTEFLLNYNYSLHDLHYTEEDGDEAMVSCWFIKK